MWRPPQGHEDANGISRRVACTRGRRTSGGDGCGGTLRRGSNHRHRLRLGQPSRPWLRKWLVAILTAQRTDTARRIRGGLERVGNDWPDDLACRPSRVALAENPHRTHDSGCFCSQSQVESKWVSRRVCGLVSKQAGAEVEVELPTDVRPRPCAWPAMPSASAGQVTRVVQLGSLL
jgi:hypothetical protein